MAGTDTVVRHFPFSVGRAGEAGLQLIEPGVWDRHAMLQFQSGDGFYVETAGEALVAVNGVLTRRTRLRNGDCIQLGGALLQVWLSSPRQQGLHCLEWLVWLGCAAVAAAQIWLISSLG